MAPLSPDFRSRGEERTDDLFDRFNVAVMNGTVGSNVPVRNTSYSVWLIGDTRKSDIVPPR